MSNPELPQPIAEAEKWFPSVAEYKGFVAAIDKLRAENARLKDTREVLINNTRSEITTLRSDLARSEEVLRRISGDWDTRASVLRQIASDYFSSKNNPPDEGKGGDANDNHDADAKRAGTAGSPTKSATPPDATPTAASGDSGTVPLDKPYRDRWNVEHDMLIGPCACGAWHSKDSQPLDVDGLPGTPASVGGDKYCKCKHRLDQAMIAHSLGSNARCLDCGKPLAPAGVDAPSGNTGDTIESLTTQAFSLISTAQRNGMTSSDSITVGIRPFLERLLELEAKESESAPVASPAAWEKAGFNMPPVLCDDVARLVLRELPASVGVDAPSGNTGEKCPECGHDWGLHTKVGCIATVECSCRRGPPEELANGLKSPLADWEKAATNIATLLRKACVGHPHAKIPWPHYLLHNAADALDRAAKVMAEKEQRIRKLESRLAQMGPFTPDAANIYRGHAIVIDGKLVGAAESAEMARDFSAAKARIENEAKRADNYKQMWNDAQKEITDLKQEAKDAYDH